MRGYVGTNSSLTLIRDNVKVMYITKWDNSLISLVKFVRLNYVQTHNYKILPLGFSAQSTVGNIKRANAST